MIQEERAVLIDSPIDSTQFRPPRAKTKNLLAMTWQQLCRSKTGLVGLTIVLLLQLLAGYFQGIPIGSPAAAKKWGDDWNRHPVGTGPFMFKFDEYRPDEVIVLEKNPNYFKPGLPYLDRIEIRMLRDPIATMTALRTGQIDFIQRVNPQHVPIMERAAGVEVVTGPDRSPLVPLHESSLRGVGNYLAQEIGREPHGEPWTGES